VSLMNKVKHLFRRHPSCTTILPSYEERKSEIEDQCKEEQKRQETFEMKQRSARINRELAIISRREMR